MPRIDEECSSISSHTDFITNEEMLIRINDGDAREKQQHKTLKLDSDTGMSHGLPIASTSNTKQLHSGPSGDYIQSSVSPYVDDTIALQQHSMSPNDSLSNQGEYVADSMAIEQCNSSVNVVPVDLGYLDYHAAVNQQITEQAASYSTDADVNIKTLKSSDNPDPFPYVVLNEDSATPLSNQLGSSYNAHGDIKGEDYTVTEVKQYAMNGVYVDHCDSSPVQQELTVNQTLLHENSSEYIQENDNGYISKQ